MKLCFCTHWVEAWWAAMTRELLTASLEGLGTAVGQVLHSPLQQCQLPRQAIAQSTNRGWKAASPTAQSSMCVPPHQMAADHSWQHLTISKVPLAVRRKVWRCKHEELRAQQQAQDWAHHWRPDWLALDLSLHIDLPCVAALIQIKSTARAVWLQTPWYSWPVPKPANPNVNLSLMVTKWCTYLLAQTSCNQIPSHLWLDQIFSGVFHTWNS